MRGVMLGTVPAAVALLALAGCGTSGPARPAASASTTPAAVTTPDAQTLVAQTLRAVGNARSVRVSGQSSGSPQDFATISITRSGDISGTFAQGSRANQFAVLATGGKVYFKVTAGFLKVAKAPAGVCSLFCGKWLLVTAAEAKSFTGSVSWSKIFVPFTKMQQTNLTIHGPVTVNGVQAWVIADTQNSATADVAAHGTPYLLRLVAPGANGGSFDFTDWNAATIPSPPPASDVISMSQLSQLG